MLISKINLKKINKYYFIIFLNKKTLKIIIITILNRGLKFRAGSFCIHENIT